MSETSADPRIERTHRLVLSATADLIGEVGFGRTTIEAIAERSGVARSTIYRHWPERGDLLLEAVTKRMIQPTLEESDNLKDGLLELLGTVARLMSAEETRLVAANFIIESARDPALAPVHRRFVDGRRETAGSILRAAIERGELPPSTDIDTFTEDLVAPIFFRTLVLHEPLEMDWLEGHIDRWIRHYRQS